MLPFYKDYKHGIDYYFMRLDGRRFVMGQMGNIKAYVVGSNDKETYDYLRVKLKKMFEEAKSAK